MVCLLVGSCLFVQVEHQTALQGMLTTVQCMAHARPQTVMLHMLGMQPTLNRRIFHIVLEPFEYGLGIAKGPIG